MSWAVHESGPAVVVRITGVRALRLTPEEARELAVALLVSAEDCALGAREGENGFARGAAYLSTELDTSGAKGQACP